MPSSMRSSIVRSRSCRLRFAGSSTSFPSSCRPCPRGRCSARNPRPSAPDLLGLFVGHDVFSQSVTQPPGTPGAIYLFRRNLLRACADREELEREVRITVQHEVGHLLGLDEDDLDQWGLA